MGMELCDIVVGIEKKKDMKKIEKLGVWEKQVALPGGRIINYGEMGGNGPALLLIHYITWT